MAPEGGAREAGEAAGSRGEAEDGLTGEAAVWAPSARGGEIRAPSDFARAARRRMVLELRCQWPPLGIRQIAEQLGISRNVVWDDLQALKQVHSDMLDGRDTAEIVGRTLDQWDIIIGKAMKGVETYSSPLHKAAMLRTASRGLEMKMKLLEQTGLMAQMGKTLDTLERLPGVGGRPEIEANKVLTVREKIAVFKAQLALKNGKAPSEPVVDAVAEPVKVARTGKVLQAESGSEPSALAQAISTLMAKPEETEP